NYIEASSEEDIKKIKAVKIFSDGSEYESRVDWDISGVDFSKKGEYEITGTLVQEHFEFPIAENRADPCIGSYKGKYYFIATNDADNNHTLFIRESETISGLVKAPEHLLLDSSTYKGIGGLLWAPEFHEIGGKFCILHAATPEPFFEEESHIMILKDGGNPVNRDDWYPPKRITLSDGSDICEMGKEITLDMTHFVWEGSDYVIWSQRQFLPKDLGAWLYIAKINPNEPWKLASKPVVLRKPLYGWENNHTFVVEGPYALVNQGKLYVTYSGAAVDTSYVVGVLGIEAGKNILEPSNWEVSNYPILTSRSVSGEYGTGHNAYCKDKDGNIWNTYHARNGVDAPRSSGIRQTFFDVDGQPVLDVTENMSLDNDLSKVKMKVIVK
ncbi:MAG: family 43 glycosylhydrolase, partial [Treponema sp.]|nr:family 43 glycosylhydrolase [Treponema sp.]